MRKDFKKTNYLYQSSLSVVESMKERKALAVLEGGLVKVAAGMVLSEENKYPTQHAQHTEQLTEQQQRERRASSSSRVG